uniref:NADH-ubiquinone oxidoreductase chain 2 n=1 Tax=Prosthiostomum siphunculus TaxID=983679 RepID=A0A0P0BZU8_9PLAT|nr:NADH dehydrogenase subunit 2 [Prosthiostomum siphunculus]ALI86953.1 NADH dehydrogenase subunit 2 [Prosthiostomum siphunculus]
MNLSWFNLKRVSNVFLIVIIILGNFLTISGSNLFIIYLGMEINMFGIIPFIILNSNYNIGKINVGIYYFLVQVFGSILFLWGALINISLLGIIGFAIKMGVSPFFLWVPSIFKRLDWFSIIIISTIQKIPSFVVLREVFDFQNNIGLLVCFSGLSVAAVGIHYSNNNIKLVLAWSSVGNMSLTFYLIMVNSQAAIMYFFSYCSVVIIIGLILIKNTIESTNFWSEVSGKSDLLQSLALGILIFSGLPPLLGFQWKLHFFSGLNINENEIMNNQIEILDYNHYMVDYPSYEVLMSWSISLLISVLLIIQVIGYIKIFINL